VSERRHIVHAIDDAIPTVVHAHTTDGRKITAPVEKRWWTSLAER
jgi:hypothetical protein